MHLRSVLLVLCIALACHLALADEAEPTKAQFSCVFPYVSNNKVDLWMPSMLDAFDYADISNTSQVAAFWALGGALTSNFETFKELGTANCPYYDGGCTYTGRGVFMLSGSSAYRRAGQALSQDFEHDPELVLQHAHAFKTAAWTWNHKDFDDYGRFWDLLELNAACDALGLTSISQKAVVATLYVKGLTCLSVDHICTWYTVAQGDTPSSIAAAQGVTVEELVALNNWSGPNQTLTPGESIKLYCT